MKRLLVLTSLSLAAVFMVTSLANGQTAPVRAATKQVTSSTSPQRDRTRPATFTTTGRVVPPPYCAAGATPVAGGNCVPLLCAPGATDPSYCVGTISCPPGTTNPSYCAPPPVALLCTGEVTVRFKRGSSTVSVRGVDVRPNCTYRSRVTFRSRNSFRRGTMTVSARFEGNDFLLPKSAPAHTVRIG